MLKISTIEAPFLLFYAYNSFTICYNRIESNSSKSQFVRFTKGLVRNKDSAYMASLSAFIIFALSSALPADKV